MAAINRPPLWQQGGTGIVQILLSAPLRVIG